MATAYIRSMPALSSPSDRRRSLTLPAGFIHPCLPMIAPRPPSGPDWLHEIKQDGLRIIARKAGDRVKLYSRPGSDLTDRFPLIVEAMTTLPSCTIDGEAVACDDRGLPSFGLLWDGKRDDRVFLFAFDLIELAGDDRRRDPLHSRKRELCRLITGAAPGLALSEWVDGKEVDGETMFDRVCSLGLEGIVSKRKDSRYLSGRSPYWLKTQNPASEAVERHAADDWK